MQDILGLDDNDSCKSEETDDTRPDHLQTDSDASDTSNCKDGKKPRYMRVHQEEKVSRFSTANMAYCSDVSTSGNDGIIILLYSSTHI